MATKRKASELEASDAKKARTQSVKVSSPWAGIDFPAPDAELSQQIDLVTSRAPRFLFRSWAPQSGGNPKLNTIDGIIPHAFLGKATTLNVHEVSREHLARTNVAHYDGGDTDPNTPFSSWTSSLGFALAYHPYESYISIVDTRQLSTGSAVFFTPAMRILDCCARGDRFEFMIYGPVSGRAHAAFSKKIMYEHAPILAQPINQLHLLYGLPFETRSETDVSTAVRLGLLFGPNFALAIAAYTVTLLDRSSDELRSIAQALAQDSRLAIPQDWAADATIMTNVVFTSGLPDEKQALVVLRHLAQLGSDAPHKPAVPLKSPEKRRSSSVRARSRSRVRKAVAGVTGNSRVSSEAKKLYVAMIGWEEPVLDERLRGRQASEANA